MKYTILIAFSILSHCVFDQSNLSGAWDTGEDNTIIEITERKNYVHCIIKRIL